MSSDPTLAGPDGQYVLRAQSHEAQISSTVALTVATDLVEDRDRSAQPKIARNIAKASGTAVARPTQLGAFVDALPTQEMSKVVSRELELWDTPVLYLLLVLLAGLEWYLRRRENLL